MVTQFMSSSFAGGLGEFSVFAPGAKVVNWSYFSEVTSSAVFVEGSVHNQLDAGGV